jgi:hypothetical protein
MRSNNRRQSYSALRLKGGTVPTWQARNASITDTWQFSGSFVVQKCTLFFMALVYKSSDTIPESGIYRVIHANHRLPHEVTLIAGQVFPPCAKCHEDVRFELVRELPELARERRGHVSLYSLPVLDDEDGPPS